MRPGRGTDSDEMPEILGDIVYYVALGAVIAGAVITAPIWLPFAALGACGRVAAVLWKRLLG